VTASINRNVVRNQGRSENERKSNNNVIVSVNGNDVLNLISAGSKTKKDLKN
jgi:hypothetical protein